MVRGCLSREAQIDTNLGKCQVYGRRCEAAPSGITALGPDIWKSNMPEEELWSRMGKAIMQLLLVGYKKFVGAQGQHLLAIDLMLDAELNFQVLQVPLPAGRPATGVRCSGFLVGFPPCSSGWRSLTMSLWLLRPRATCTRLPSLILTGL